MKRSAETMGGEKQHQSASTSLKTLNQTLERLKHEKDEAERRLREEFDRKSSRITSEMKRLLPATLDECRRQADEERRAYIREWATTGGYVFRTNPFYHAIGGGGSGQKSHTQQRLDLAQYQKRFQQQQQQQQQQQTPKRQRSLMDSVATEGVSIRVTGRPFIYDLLALHDEAFASRFFDGLGPMELFCVYRTSRTMRRALVSVLSRCLPRFVAFVTTHAPTDEQKKKKKNEKDVAHRTLSLATLESLLMQYDQTVGVNHHDRYYVVPRILDAAQRICCQWSRPYFAPLGVARRFPTTFEWCLDDMFVVSSDGRTQVTPLVNCNVFLSTQYYIVSAHVQQRYTGEMGTEAGQCVAKQPMAYFTSQDWRDMALQPLPVAAAAAAVPFDPDSRFVSPRQLFVVNEKTSTISAVGSLEARDAAGDDTDNNFIVVTNVGCTTKRDSVLWQEPRLYDHYEVRMAVLRSDNTFRSIGGGAGRRFDHHSIEDIEMALNGVLHGIEFIVETRRRLEARLMPLDASQLFAAPCTWKRTIKLIDDEVASSSSDSDSDAPPLVYSRSSTNDSDDDDDDDNSSSSSGW
jgi:hypothetical protein